MQTKTCTKCLKTLPATKEFFRQNLTHKYGLLSWCKVCERPRVDAWTHSKKYKEYRRTRSNTLTGKLKFQYRKSFINRMKRMVSGKGVLKNCFIENKIGYPIELVIKKFESMFRDGMNWDNYGKLWEIDHIRPVYSFKEYPFTEESIKECWSLTNLQPLLKIENIKKWKTLPSKLDSPDSSSGING
jgi:hypothetical protein